MRKTRTFVWALLLAGIASGCATIRPRVTGSRFGQADPEADRQIAEQAELMTETPKDVRVMKGAVPDGLAITDNGSKIAVAAGYETKYEILGTVEADYVQPYQGAMGRNMFWKWDYEETWRKVLCYPQVPFKIVTLSLWSMFVPLNWPCWATVPGDEADRNAAMIERLKRGAQAMGANLVILTSSGSLQIISGNQYGVSSSVVPAMTLTGFAVREKAGEPAPAATPASAAQ